ncbi:hypothetical protein AAFF_G00267540 [Aldrovandia affinis]|uniref:Uncharacterized protein n=1 Tax=Aldrovandia affinis TaxID=143900 RepID=A0AAD7SSB4_9TELE|nr:hypothetical protein AAFF_G00267540 [Aldrovandia affinis]
MEMADYAVEKHWITQRQMDPHSTTPLAEQEVSTAVARALLNTAEPHLVLIYETSATVASNTQSLPSEHTATVTAGDS